MFSHKIKFCLALLLSVTFGFSGSGRLLAGDDIYYLENEIRETEAKYKIIHADLQRIDDFLAKYPGMTEALAKAHKELDDLETRMRDLLQKNLIKSTIKLGFETYGKVNLVLGFATQSIHMIVLACACEAASDQMQNSFSTPYSKAVKGLSDEAMRAAPEIEEVQKTLAMDEIDLKIKVMRGGEDPDNLGETGLIYRKFYYILESIAKAKKKIYELRKNLDKTKAEVEAARPATAEEDERLAKRLEELKKRLQAVTDEITKAKTAEQQSQINSAAVIPVSPVPMHVKDEQERQALISQYINTLWSLVNQGQKKADEIDSRLHQETRAMFPGQNYDPLTGRSATYPLPNPLPEKEVTSMGPQELTQEINFYKVQIDFNKKFTEVIKKYPAEFDALDGEFTGQVAPVMSALAGLGGDYKQAGAESVSQRIAGASVSLNDLLKRIPQEDKIYQENIDKMNGQFERLVSSAKDASAKIATEASNTLEAMSFAVVKGKTFLQTAQSSGFNTSAEASARMNKIRDNVRQMFIGGATGAKVKEYLEKEKKVFTDLYEQASHVGHLRRLALNTYLQFNSMGGSDPAYGLVNIMVKDYPEKGVKDMAAPYVDQFWAVDLNGNPDIREKVFGRCAEIENWSYTYGDEIRDFLTWIPKIEEANQKAQAIMSSMEYYSGYSKMTGTVSELLTDQALLNNWLQFYPSPDGGKTPGYYRVLSTQTLEVIQAALKRMQDKEEADVKAKRDQAAAEEAKKREEARKKQQEEEADRAGYRLMNTRINTIAVPNFAGELVLTDSDLRDGSVTLTALLNNDYGVQKVLISEDGRLFKESPLSRDLSYTFAPMSEKRYEPAVKLKMESGEDKVLPFLVMGQVLVYKNIDYTRMVAEAIKALADSYEAMSVARFSELISRDYLGNRTFLEEGVRFDFDMFMDIRLQIFINRIERRGGVYVCEAKWTKTQMVRKTGQQQRTDGSTTFVFVLEDGKMKIQNLRGNLIYATLSPEIAESSGLSQTIVEEIRIAQQDRDPIQPGAGQTQESGTNSSSASLSARSGQVHNTSIPFWEVFSFDFVSGTEGAAAAGDFNFETNQIFLNGAAKIKNMTGAYTFSGLAEAPADDGTYLTSADNPIPVAAGEVYAFITGSGYYGKMSVTSLSGADPFYMDFQYAVQTDRTRNVRT